MNFKKILNSEKYNFIREDENLGDNIMLLTLGGSHAYGTNNEQSDIDFRGICYNPKSQLLGLSEFEQIIEQKTDTVIYGLKKMVGLLLNCNPNVIEILGCEEEHYLVLNQDGRLLKDNADVFILQRAINSFGGYANQQLRRLQNAIARDSLATEMKERHIAGSIENQMMSFNERYSKLDNGDFMNVSVVDASLRFNSRISDYSLRDFICMISEMNECVRNYDKLNHRNNKKDDLHLNKHAMHLVRLYYMAIDILEDNGIKTYRENERDILLSIRNGFYMNEDGTYKNEFFEFLDRVVARFEYAKKNTNIPKEPDYKKAQDLVMTINERFIKNN